MSRIPTHRSLVGSFQHGTWSGTSAVIVIGASPLIACVCFPYSPCLCCAAFVAAKSRRSGRTDSSVSAFERTMTSSLRLNGGKTRASVDIPRRVIGGSQTVHCAVIVSAAYGCASAGLQAGAFCGRCKRARDLARGVCAAALAADVALA